MTFKTCRLAFVIALLLPLFSAPLFAQETDNSTKFADPVKPKNIIKVAPFAFLHGQMPFTVESRFGYERVIGRKISVAGSYSHLGSNPVFGFIGSVALSATLTTALTLYGKPGKAGIIWTETKVQPQGYRYQFQFKKYIGKKAAASEGFYLSPQYSYAQADYDIEMANLNLKFKLKATNRNYNLLIGYQGILGKHFILDVFTGLGYRQKNTDIFDGESNYLGKMDKGTPIKLSSGLNIGWAF